MNKISDKILENLNNKNCSFFKKDSGLKSSNLYEDFLEAVDKYLSNGSELSDLGLITLENVSAKELNARIEKKYNPKSDIVYKSADKILKINSRVIQTRNNFKLNVMNGEIGYIVGISNIDNIKYVEINYNGRIVQYSEDDLKYIELAYVLTIYKAQGLKFNHIVLLVTWFANTRFNKSVLETTLGISKDDTLIIGNEGILLEKLSEEENFMMDRMKDVIEKAK